MLIFTEGLPCEAAVRDMGTFGSGSKIGNQSSDRISSSGSASNRSARRMPAANAAKTSSVVVKMVASLKWAETSALISLGVFAPLFPFAHSRPGWSVSQGDLLFARV